MCFGSWPIWVEKRVLLILEPGGVEIDIQAISGNEGIDMVSAQVLYLLSQGGKCDAWSGLDRF